MIAEMNSAVASTWSAQAATPAFALPERTLRSSAAQGQQISDREQHIGGAAPVGDEHGSMTGSTLGAGGVLVEDAAGDGHDHADQSLMDSRWQHCYLARTDPRHV
jgi:hypothetical protein